MINDAIDPKALKKYEQDLLQSINQSRRMIFDKFKDQGIVLNQMLIRKMSWTASQLYYSQQGFRTKVDELFQGKLLPLKVGRTPQDANHLNHFVNATLLFLFHQNLKIEFLLDKPFKPLLTLCKEDQAKDLLYRLESTDMLCHMLLQAFPKDCPSIQQQALPTRSREDEILKLLNEIQKDLKLILNKLA